jgi:1-acyl-sn-glycerol-3-phosphate acyltransferase
MLMFNPLFNFIFKITGWKLQGNIPVNLHKSIVIVCPHASWVDFPVGLGARSLLRKKIYFWGKQELFKGPFGWLFKMLGGYPVDRSKNTNLVSAIVDIYQAKNSFHAVLAPEGTRKDVQELRTGFYYIAVQAEIPIIMVGFDYVNKIIKVNDPFYPSGDFEIDKKVIAIFFQSIPGVQKSWITNYLR